MTRVRHVFHVGAEAEAVAASAAKWIAARAAECVGERGRFSVALAGGSTPRRVYQLLAGEAGDGIDWAKTHVFFGDERCVPPDDAGSNYRMAREALLSRVAVPPENVHRMIGEGDAVANARLYEDEMRSFFGGVEWPEFDLVLLGLGDDGHTASLFPATPALDERSAWASANWVEKLGAFRITLTAPAVNHAARVLFLVTGAGKARALAEVVEGRRDPHRLPAQLIEPRAGAIDWFIDEAAAARLGGGLAAGAGDD